MTTQISKFPKSPPLMGKNLRAQLEGGKRKILTREDEKREEQISCVRIPWRGIYSGEEGEASRLRVSAR